MGIPYTSHPSAHSKHHQKNQIHAPSILPPHILRIQQHHFPPSTDTFRQRYKSPSRNSAALYFPPEHPLRRCTFPHSREQENEPPCTEERAGMASSAFA